MCSALDTIVQGSVSALFGFVLLVVVDRRIRLLSVTPFLAGNGNPPFHLDGQFFDTQKLKNLKSWNLPSFLFSSTLFP